MKVLDPCKPSRNHGELKIYVSYRKVLLRLAPELLQTLKKTEKASMLE